MFDKGSLDKKGQGKLGPEVCCCLNLTLVVHQSHQGTLGTELHFLLELHCPVVHANVKPGRCQECGKMVHWPLLVPAGACWPLLAPSAAASSLHASIAFSEMISFGLLRTMKHISHLSGLFQSLCDQVQRAPEPCWDGHQAWSDCQRKEIRPSLHSASVHL